MLAGALAGAALLGAAGVWITLQLLAASAGPTAKSVALGMGALITLSALLIGALAGRAAGAARARGRRGTAAAIAVLCLAAAGWLSFRAYQGRLEAQRLEAIRTQPLTEARARALMSGPPEDVRALAFNQSCPPAVLAELAKSPDEVVRAGVAENRSTPPAVLQALQKDPSQTVLSYLKFNPQLKKTP